MHYKKITGDNYEDYYSNNSLDRFRNVILIFILNYSICIEFNNKIYSIVIYFIMIYLKITST